MKRKKKIPISDKSKLLVFGYYRDKNNKLKYGFVKHDGRKKQKIVVKRGLKTYELENTNKRNFKKIKKNIDSAIEKKQKSISGIKIKEVERVIPKIEFVKSKEYTVKNQKRIRALEIVDIENFPLVFYNAFDTANESNAKKLVYIVKLKVEFVHRKKYSYVKEHWIFSQTYFSDLSQETIQNEIDNIVLKIFDAVNDIFKSYEVEFVRVINDIAWILE